MSEWWWLLVLWPLSGWIGGPVTWRLEFDRINGMTVAVIAICGFVAGPILPLIWLLLHLLVGGDDRE